MTTGKPLSPAQHVANSRARVIAAGGRRIPNGVFSPAANQALQKLHDAGYADSLTACMERALIEASERRED